MLLRIKHPNLYEDLWEEEEIDDTEKKQGSHHEPASSEGRSVSVFDRIGKKLTEHDLRLKFEKLTFDKKDK